MAAFEYLVVRYFHENIKKSIWCIKWMLFTRHSEFCHQSFDTFAEHISVFIGERANIPQVCSSCHSLIKFSVSSFRFDILRIFDKKHLYLSLKTWESKLIFIKSRVSYVKLILQFDWFKSHQINLKVWAGPTFKKKPHSADLIIQTKSDFSILRCQICWIQ